MTGVESKAQSPGGKDNHRMPENVDDFQQCVNEILTLIKQDGNFSEKTAGIYNSKMSKLTEMVNALASKHKGSADLKCDVIKQESSTTQSDSKSKSTANKKGKSKGKECRIDDPKLLLNKYEKENEGLKKKNRDLTIEKSILQATNDKLLEMKSLVGDAQADIIMFDRERKTWEGVLKGSRDQVKQLEEQVKQLEQEIAQLKEDAKKQADLNVNLEKDVISGLAKIEKGKDELEGSKEQVKQLEQKVKMGQEIITKLRAEIESKIDVENGKLKGLLQKRNNEILKLKQELVSRVAEINDGNIKWAELSDRVKSSNAYFDYIKELMEKVGEDSNKLRVEVQLLRAKLAAHNAS